MRYWHLRVVNAASIGGFLQMFRDNQIGSVFKGPMGCPETSVITNLRCVTSQKGEGSVEYCENAISHISLDPAEAKLDDSPL
jgi:hypothetical protein